VGCDESHNQYLIPHHIMGTWPMEPRVRQQLVLPPTALYAFRLSIGAGLLTNFFLLAINTMKDTSLFEKSTPCMREKVEIQTSRYLTTHTSNIQHQQTYYCTNTAGSKLSTAVIQLIERTRAIGTLVPAGIASICSLIYL